MTIQGKVVKYGDNVNTDVIIPSKYLVFTDPQALATHAMEGLDPDFLQKIRSRPIVAAGKNFGCGSSREQAPIALKYAGATCVVADSFARIFYRNAINIGLPVLECNGISAQIRDGAELRVTLEQGLIEDLAQGRRFQAIPLPPFLLAILDKGLVDYMRSRGR
jgi:3-isopropylmalate/(R)-2-methylmalate dehydratase small subunit